MVVSRRDFGMLLFTSMGGGGRPERHVCRGPKVFSVNDYGAVGDGIADDTAAIQAALDAAGRAGGGVVRLSPGTYSIRPGSVTDAAALYINHDDVHLIGAGSSLSKLNFQLFDGRDPASTVPPPLVNGIVQRGHGIKLKEAGVKNVTIANLELDGNAGCTGNFGFPADVTTGDGWDLTHKGILMGYGSGPIDNVTISDCYVHSWRGENIYSGGNQLGRLTIARCEVSDSNGSLISVGAQRLLLSDSHLHDTANAGIENAYFGGLQTYRGNAVENCARGGIIVFPATPAPPHAFIEIASNFVHNCGNHGIFSLGPRNMRIHDNVVVDCLIGVLITHGNGGSGTDSISTDNLAIFDNRIVADTTSVLAMVIIAALEVARPTHVHIYDNTGVVTAAGVANGKEIQQAVGDYTAAGLFWGVGCRVERNYLNGVIQNLDTGP
jgi:hypothetical protein